MAMQLGWKSRRAGRFRAINSASDKRRVMVFMRCQHAERVSSAEPARSHTEGPL